MYRFFFTNRYLFVLASLILGGSLGFLIYIDYVFADKTIPFMGQKLRLPLVWLNDCAFNISSGALAFAAAVPVIFTSKKMKVIWNLGGQSFNLDDIKRGTLITGKTGSGKTAAAIATILRQTFIKLPDFGAVCLDMKGNFFVVVQKIAKAFGQEEKIVTLQVRPDSIIIRLRLQSETEVLNFSTPSSSPKNLLI